MPISATQNLIQKTLKPRGVHFPFSKRGDGLPSADGPPDIFASNIKQILLTTPGERRMRPTFGTGLKALLFADITNNAVLDLAKIMVIASIKKWEPRVKVLSVDILTQNTTIKIKVRYMSGVGTGEAEILLKKAAS
jgi:phage baseplate assembly protein W